MTDDLADLIRRVLAAREAGRRFLPPADIPRPAPPDGRRFVAIVFADIVDSTGILGRMGDEAWGDLLAQYYGGLEAQVRSFGGEEVDRAGDGLLVTFPMASTAVTFGIRIAEFAQSLDLHLHLGVHAGEIMKKGKTVSGMAVHIAYRVAGEAEPDEVLVTSTVRELTLGGSHRFADRGIHSLKGFSEGWHLFSADE